MVVRKAEWWVKQKAASLVSLMEMLKVAYLAWQMVDELVELTVNWMDKP